MTLGKRKLKEIQDFFVESRRQALETISHPQEFDTAGDEVDKIQGALLISTNNQIVLRAKEKVRAYDFALARIEAGTFGECGECGEEIPEKRLMAKPECVTCISCAEKLELLAARFGK